MEVQRCWLSDIQEIDLGRDAQCDMIERCRRFQRSLGLYDDRLSDLPANPYCQPALVINQLDCAIQECSEAWDLVEGGWKHWKRKPKPADQGELVMELVDVAHFLYNAYLYMGGQPEAELIASAANRSNGLKYKEMGLETVWGIAQRSLAKNRQLMEVGYGYGSKAHGEQWEKDVATLVNHLRCRIAVCRDTIHGFWKESEYKEAAVPAASGFIAMETFPWLYACLQAVPGMTPGLYYAAFVRKNDINFERQRNAY